MVVLIGVVWEGVSAAGLVNPIIVPPLSRIAADFAELPNEPIFWRSLMTTVQEMLVGLTIGVLIGIVLGALGATFGWFRRSLLPYVVALQSMPRISLAPVFLIWLGFGIESKIAIAAAICFFPVVVNTMAGLESARQDQQLVFRSLGASSRQRLLMLTLPTAAPYVFAGVKTALSLALAGAIAAEFVSSSAGLGFMIASATFVVNVPRVFSVLCVLALVGGAAYLLVELIDRRLIFWRTTARS